MSDRVRLHDQPNFLTLQLLGRGCFHIACLFFILVVGILLFDRFVFNRHLLHLAIAMHVLADLNRCILLLDGRLGQALAPFQLRLLDVMVVLLVLRLEQETCIQHFLVF